MKIIRFLQIKPKPEPTAAQEGLSRYASAPEKAKDAIQAEFFANAAESEALGYGDVETVKATPVESRLRRNEFLRWVAFRRVSFGHDT